MQAWPWPPTAAINPYSRLRPQELLLPRPAQGLPDLPVRAAAGRATARLEIDARRREASGSASPASTWRRTPASSSTTSDHGACSLRRLQPRRRAAARDRHRARPPHPRGGRRLPADAARHPASTSRSATATWRRGASAATPTSPCGPQGATRARHPTELKNMNSFRNVRAGPRATRSSARARSSRAGGEVVQETRLWDADQGITDSMRSKEEAHDYRYFPEPDLVPSS